MKNNIKIVLSFILGAIIFGSIGVYASTLMAKDVEFSSSKENWQAGNVGEALDDLYCMAKEKQEVVKFTASNVSAASNKSNVVGKVTLEKGIYVVSAYASYAGFDLRYHISLDDYNSSAYDNTGYVRMNITNIIEVKEDSKEISFIVWPTDKSITLDTVIIKAIRIY
nr:hypothetical protein [Bacilli bacterium]